jgi:hypothetical protein
MEITITVWEKNGNSVSVHTGPISYSLKIGEKWVRYEGTDKWPAYEVFPTTPWNYGLVLDIKNPSSSFKIINKKPNNQPFTHEGAPIELKAKGRRIPNWKLFNNTVDRIQKSPIKSGEPEDEITLIPMGCARLRITSFPMIGDDSEARDWVEPPPPRHKASHIHENIYAPSDGLVPRSSNDPQCPRFTWWDRKGTTEWITFEFDKPRKVSKSEVYWYVDRGGKKFKAPDSWKVFYHDGKSWKPVKASSGFGTKLNQFNSVEFEAVETSSLKLQVDLQQEYSAGIFEWKVE